MLARSNISLISSLLDELETFPGGGGWGAGSSETKANLAQPGLELGLSLAINVVRTALNLISFYALYDLTVSCNPCKIM